MAFEERPKPTITPGRWTLGESPASPAGSDPRLPATVSVVIPVKDDAVLLVHCLAALAAQTLPPDEIVVVDNGSTDDSAAVARRAGARVVTCPEPGIPAAASTGYDSARGDLILRLDADCVPAPDWVETVVRAFDRHPDVASFTGHASFIDGPRVVRGPLAFLYLGAYASVGLLALGHVPLFGSNLAIRRDAWEKVSASVHRNDPSLHDDLDLSFHLGEHHRIRYLPSASMGMSMRPFASAVAFAGRTWRGVNTVTAHWPEDVPPRRWIRLLAHQHRR